MAAPGLRESPVSGTWAHATSAHGNLAGSQLQPLADDVKPVTPAIEGGFVQTADVLLDAFGRVREEVHAVVEDLTPEQVTFRVEDRSNSIGWLVWHLTRIQDAHIAEIVDDEQIWTDRGWAERFSLPYPPEATGYGQTAKDVASFRLAAPDLLLGYYNAVHDRTAEFVGTVTADDLDRIVDESWDPPVTLGVRLVSIISDDLQHVGQAAFIRGLLDSDG